MIIFPAVDLQQGKAVRLKQGKADQATVFADNPLEAALAWQDKGAQWLHLVDLDGAFDGRSLNGDLVRQITAALRIPTQLGGGIRDLDGAKAWFAAGVRRLIIGTVALENPSLFARICADFPGKVGISLDAEHGLLKTRGWLQDTGLHIDDVLPQLVSAGAAFVIYTDISRDGMQVGVNLPDLTHLASVSPIPVIAAGGVHSLDDIKALYPLSTNANLEGVISGKALYAGSLDLETALAWIAAQA